MLGTDKPNATQGGGMRCADIVAAWDRAFMPREQGGCQAVAVPPWHKGSTITAAWGDEESNAKL